MRVGSLVKNLNTGSMGIVVKVDNLLCVHIDWFGSSMTGFEPTVWNIESRYLEIICK